MSEVPLYMKLKTGQHSYNGSPQRWSHVRFILLECRRADPQKWMTHEIGRPSKVADPQKWPILKSGAVTSKEESCVVHDAGVPWSRSSKVFDTKKWSGDQAGWKRRQKTHLTSWLRTCPTALFQRSLPKLIAHKVFVV